MGSNLAWTRDRGVTAAPIMVRNVAQEEELGEGGFKSFSVLRPREVFRSVVISEDRERSLCETIGCSA